MNKVEGLGVDFVELQKYLDALKYLRHLPEVVDAAHEEACSLLERQMEAKWDTASHLTWHQMSKGWELSQGLGAHSNSITQLALLLELNTLGLHIYTLFQKLIQWLL